MDRKIEKKKWTIKKIATYGTGILLLLFIIYNFLLGDSSSKLNVQKERLTLSTVSKGPFQEFIPVTGNVVPIKTVYLDAVEGGRVEVKYIEEGTLVEIGDKILKLDNTNLHLDIMYREAELFQQINNLRNTRLDMERTRLNLQTQIAQIDYDLRTKKRIYERNKELFQKNLISRFEYEQSQDEFNYLSRSKDLTIETHKQDSVFRVAQIKQLEASVRRMQENLEIVKNKLENLVIKAPISGQLTSLNAEIGESKALGERLGQIDVLDSFKVRVDIDEHYIARIEIGKTGNFEFAGNTYNLEILKIYPEVLNGRFGVDMYFTDEVPQGIRRGQTLHIRLALGDLSEAILLARGGFYQKTGGQWVYLVDESGEYAVKQPIRLGRQNPQHFEVIEGLHPGQMVITSSYETFGENDKLVLK
ncbi:MAG: HlyD family efflux transporter periplasmic adaptor subunit [bacterium]|nr:MAG: HlyD family efflux transporter periplasmic adaptor subunit [bacterium]